MIKAIFNDGEEWDSKIYKGQDEEEITAKLEAWLREECDWGEETAYVQGYARPIKEGDWCDDPKNMDFDKIIKDYDGHDDFAVFVAIDPKEPKCAFPTHSWEEFEKETVWDREIKYKCRICGCTKIEEHDPMVDGEVMEGECRISYERAFDEFSPPPGSPGGGLQKKMKS